MKSFPHCLISLLSILLLPGIVLSLHISPDGFESHPDTSPALLQTKTTCKEDFSRKNYKIITSVCKGPDYPVKTCCYAFKNFACSFAEAINDKTTDCATKMVSYINLYGLYPAGMFANICEKDKKGLDCTNVTTMSSSHALIPTVSTRTLLITFFLFCLL